MVPDDNGGGWPLPINQMAPAVIEALEHARIGFVIAVEREGVSRRIYVSQAAAALLGGTREELMASAAMADLAPEEIPRLAEMRQRRLRGEPVPERFETVVVHRSTGKRTPVEVGTSHTTLAGEAATIAFFFDISERKRADARFRTLIEGAPEGIAVLRAGRISYVNGAVGRMLGFEAAELEGRAVAELTHPDDVPVMIERLRTLVATGKQLAAPHEYRIFHRDGHLITVEIASMPLELEEGPAVLGFLRDVTERKRLQAQLLQADRMAAVGLLAAGVAHEINNPLAYVLLNLGFLSRDLPGCVAGDSPAALDVLARLDEVREGAERVATIVRDLLAFSRTEERLGPVDVRAVMDSALKMAAATLRHRARVVIDYVDVPLVQATEARLGQVFLNLLVNAAQALDARPEVNEVRIAIRAVPATGLVMVEVADNGPGIPADVLERIFEPFFTTKPIGVGHGLGLSICHTIVAGLGGDLTARSVVGQGATFTVTLPAAPHS